MGRLIVDGKKNDLGVDDLDQNSDGEIIVLEEGNKTESRKVSSTTNKLNGYIRTESDKPDSKNGGVSSTNNGLDTAKTSSELPANENKINRGRVRYCHYFSNFGKCTYEENSEKTCRFEHSKSPPMCQSGTSCSRPKCMYKHPTIPKSSSFLTSNYPYPINPWQMMTPWWGPPTNQVHPFQQSHMNVERK